MPQTDLRQQNKEVIIMIVQHNITSMNANRQLGIVGSNLAKSTEKLSSGYKINRAADDAAGLAISEKMRAQVRGLNRASDNAQDGISLIQTAEGAMDQQHAILQRTRELLVQASNSGVLDASSENDFQKIQDEIDTLKQEYTRINTDTEFNRKKLLDGSYKDQYLQVGANQNQGIEVTIKETKWDEGLYLSKKTDAAGQTHKNGDAAKGIVIDGNDTVGYTKTAYNTNIFTVSATKVVTPTGKEVLATDYTKYKTAIEAGVKTAATAKEISAAEDAAQKLGFSSLDSIKGTDAVDTNKWDATNDTDGTMVTAVSGQKISGLIDNVDSMIKSVTTERSKLGAVQNRLEYTVKVDDNTAENLQSAESRIRDTDMADEMTRFSKESILQQAATSMLAQANQSNQGVLSLLQ